jgi:hypothetical protein
MNKLSEVAKKCFEVRSSYPISRQRGTNSNTISRPIVFGSSAQHFFFLSQNDVQMVSMLYRTHKSLEPQYKVPSLYAFDALARAARTHALKHGFTGDAQSGNSATFLLKLEAVLEGLFQDMSSGVPEGKVSDHV